MTELNFEPRLEIAALQGGELMVVFDLGLDDDRKRSPRAVRVPEFKQLSIELSGFDALEPVESDEALRVLRGNVVLLYTRLNESVMREPLAEVELILRGEGSGKKSAPSFPPAAAVADVLRAGVADALVEAMAGLASALHERSAPRATSMDASMIHVPAVAASGAARTSSGARIFGSAARRSRGEGRQRNLFWPIVATGPVVVFTIWALGVLFGGAATPPVAMAATYPGYDPESVDAQIELTKAALRDMGLDPGDSAADLGCLVQQ